MTMLAQGGQVRELTDAEAWDVLEQRAQRRLHIGAREFIERWLAGEYGAPDDNPDALEIAILLPGVGINPWRNGKQA